MFRSALLKCRYVGKLFDPGYMYANQLGTMHLPRIGEEVLVDFLGGDPDLYSHGYLNYSSDVQDLHLQIDASKINRVLHVVALDEYRANFSCTNIRSTVHAGKGYELGIPGAHSDVGGGYTSDLAPEPEQRDIGETRTERNGEGEQIIRGTRAFVYDKGWYGKHNATPTIWHGFSHARKISGDYYKAALSLMVDAASKYTTAHYPPNLTAPSNVPEIEALRTQLRAMASEERLSHWVLDEHLGAEAARSFRNRFLHMSFEEGSLAHAPVLRTTTNWSARLFTPSVVPNLGRRRFAFWAGTAGPLLAANLYAPAARAAGLASLIKGTSMNTPQTAVFQWDVSFCSYGIDVDPRASSRVETLPSDNIMWDAQGLEVARFYSGMGAAWGLGGSIMGGPDRNGARLPQRLLFTYYDYLEDRFYQLKTELPIQKLFELFSLPGLARDSYKARPKFQSLCIGVAPLGNVTIWVSGFTDNQLELGTYRADALAGMTPKSYNASGTRPFPLREDRWEELRGGRAKPETIERIKAGWVPDPSYYMRRIRVKFPWRFKLTGNVSRVTDILSYEANAEITAYGTWEMGLYQTVNTMHAVPEGATFWFHDLAGKRHYLWLRFWKRERAVSEADMTDVFAAFEQVLGKRTQEDNLFAPNDEDMAAVEVHVGDDFQTITASLVKATVRVALPVGRTRHFALEPYAYWDGNPTPASDVIKLFQEGPPKAL